MKITGINIDVLEIPGQTRRIHQLIQVPGLRRTQYTHTGHDTGEQAYCFLMRVTTDSGITGECTIEWNATPASLMSVLELLRLHLIGEDPLYREFIYQKLLLGTRWVYQRPGWFGAVDNCLWDIAGKAADLSISQLLGRMRDAVPIYQTAGDGPVELYMEHVDAGRELGIRAYKPHSYKGGDADIPIMGKLREYVGDDYDLMLDPVCSYTFREAVNVGNALEDLGFVWLEEPFHEHKMHLYQELCASLTIPIIANETLMNDVGVSAQWLIHGATDRLRANARHGTTMVVKMAHFAELYSTTIELNGTGGLFGIVHAHLGCAIANNSYYEHSVGSGHFGAARLVGLTNPPTIVDGALVPPDGPGWGAVWDNDVVRKNTAQTL